MQKWILFLVRYLVFLAAGTAVIHFGTPQIKERQLLTNRNVEAFSRKIIGAEARARTKQRINESIDSVRQDVQSAQQTASRPQHAAAPVTTPTTTAARPAAQQPARSRIVSANPTWAIVNSNQAPHYDRTGRNRGNLPAGTILSVQDIQDNRGVELVIGQRLGLSSTSPLILVRKSDLMLLGGNPDAISHQEKQLRANQARLQADISERESEMRSALRSDNPHADEYKQALAAYQSFNREVRDLQQKRDAASGPSRMDFADKLRMLLRDGSEIKEAHDSAKARYDQWNAANPPRDAGRDETLESYRRQLAEIEAELES